MRITGKVLVASDLGAGSDAAIRQAAAIARQAGVALVACHVMPEMFGIRPLFPHLREVDRQEADRVRNWATDALEDQLERVIAPGTPRPEVRIEAGSPHEIILGIAEEVGAGLVVVGGIADRGAGGLGGVAERVARHASCPVLIASAKNGRCVLAATDFSDPALPAVRLAEEEAAFRKLPLVILHVIDLRASHLGLPEMVSSSLIERLTEGARAEARDRSAELAKSVGPDSRIVAREGAPVDEILAVAEAMEAEVIVMGTHGRSGFARFALGSVAEGVMRRSRCSTLVVRLERCGIAPIP